MKQKLFSMIALMLMTAVSAMAQTETLLTTITATGQTTYGQSVEGVVTVTLSNILSYDNSYGWLWDGTITVEPVEGYTITKCRFIQNAKTPLDDDLAPFSISLTLYGCSVVTSTGTKSNDRMDGVTSIEVYGYANAPATVAVTSVSLSQTEAALNIGESMTLTTTVAPDDATDKTVTWTSSDETVATVADGVVTALAAGTATITATANDGSGVTGTCTVTVTDPATKYDLTVGENEHGTVAFTVDGAAATQAKKDDVVTVSVTPNEGYSTKDVTVRAYTTWNAAPARAKSRAAAPELVGNIDVTPGESGTWSFTMPEANVWVVVTYTKNLQDAWIEAISDQTYTGEALTPAIVVKDGETTLALNTDYTVAYSDNTETGTATVTVTGTGDYSGTATATFIIRADKTALNTAITEAEAYYNSISETNPDAAATLLEAINAAKAVQGNADATQTEVETATTTLNAAVSAAQADVALKRITLVIPAKSYIARVDADKRQIETAVEGVSLYSVKSVTDSEVELTAELSVIAAEMPYLIYNDNDEEKTISIVVSAEDATAVEYDSDHFKGTLVDKTFTDEDMAAADHYVLTNNNFVWVKDAGTLAAGKCWIELVPASEAHARKLAIVAEGGLTPTGITSVRGSKSTDNVYYDLSGRRVAQPTKGLFIVNGKKVVVK